MTPLITVLQYYSITVLQFYTITVTYFRDGGDWTVGGRLSTGMCDPGSGEGGAKDATWVVFFVDDASSVTIEVQWF